MLLLHGPGKGDPRAGVHTTLTQTSNRTTGAFNRASVCEAAFSSVDTVRLEGEQTAWVGTINGDNSDA